MLIYPTTDVPIVVIILDLKENPVGLVRLVTELYKY